jgi:hypothetical protein
MLHEFAVEPSLLGTWQNVRYFMGKFGVDQGRLISRYPRRWERLVLEGLSCGPVEKARIEETLRRGKNRLLHRFHEWRDGTPWLVNAEEEHSKRPFHAILADANPNTQPFILLEADLDDTQPPKLWDIPRTRIVKRTALEMVGALRVLLRMAKTVLFVDRNFGPKSKNFRLVLEGCLLAMLDQHKKCQAHQIEYHTGDALDGGEFTRLCQGHLPDIIPNGVRVRVVRWRSEDLHNRYVLTDVGGISFGQGLDQASDTAQQDDVVTLLDRAVAEELLQGFIGSPPKYTRDPVEVLLTGRKTV